MLLCYFKYINFFLQTINAVSDTHFGLLSLGFPLAISFYTFQQISFLVDCHQHKAEEKNFLNYCLFVTFFPQLVAGPIVRHREMMPQFAEGGVGLLDWNNIANGLFVFGLGLFKKVIIADSFARWADAGFSSAEALSFFQAWSVSLSYTFQLYYDFSGYTDMAIGAALLFNIRLPINFNSPYKALNIRNFWQRWHISLSRWLRDYLYIPLGGNRKGTARTLINIIITFLICGIWHGAGWTFIVWGALHGAALAVHRLWRSLGLRLPNLLAWLCTFLYINGSFVFFRAESITDGLRILKAMLPLRIESPALLAQIAKIDFTADIVTLWGLQGPLLSTAHQLLFIVVFPFIALVMPNTMQLIRFESYQGRLAFKPTIVSAFLLAFVLFISFMTYLGNVSQSEFLYFNF
jgi:alginate O-acetyltransferase complex protein AlgI